MSEQNEKFTVAQHPWDADGEYCVLNAKGQAIAVCALESTAEQIADAINAATREPVGADDAFNVALNDWLEHKSDVWDDEPIAFHFWNLATRHAAERERALVAALEHYADPEWLQSFGGTALAAKALANYKGADEGGK